MSKPTTRTELLRQAYAALNRGDAAGFVAAFDPQVVRIEFENSPQEGVYRGLAAVKEHVDRARATWAEGTCEPQQFIVAGDRIVVLVRVRVMLKLEAQHANPWREGNTADVFTFCDDKVIEFRTFLDTAEALQFAGANLEDKR